MGRLLERKSLKKSPDSERKAKSKEKEIIKRLLFQLEEQGYKTRVVSLKHVSALQREINKWRRQKAICEELDRDYLKEFDFNLPWNLFKVRSIIILAFPQPIIQVFFKVDGKSFPMIIPPTYCHSSDEKVENLLLDILRPDGFHVAKAILPLKSLAVHSGLAEYGKNNIAYMQGMGSFFRLNAFYSDLPIQEDSWTGHQTMERCHNCSACFNACPPQAISSERFLLHAERCITFHNESQRDFPSWLDPSWHQCLVGCLRCQAVCPENRDFKDWIKNKGTFSEAETALFLDRLPMDKLPAETENKLEKLYMMEYLEILPRNMRALLSNTEKR
jgi:epoxyqueuosine reductase